MHYYHDMAREHRLYTLWSFMLCFLGDADDSPSEKHEKHLRPKFYLAWECLNEHIPGLGLLRDETAP
jgi:hypothetical protein